MPPAVDLDHEVDVRAGLLAGFGDTPGGELTVDGDGDVDNADVFQVRSRRATQFKGY